MSDEIQHGDGQYDAVSGDGVQPAELGYAPPNEGAGEGGESEIPTGVDALTDEQIQKAQENAPSGGDEGGEGGGDGAIDVAAIMEDGGADASGDADADASGDDDADADASGGDVEAEAEGNAADDAGEDATEMTDPEAAVAPNTGEA